MTSKQELFDDLVAFIDEVDKQIPYAFLFSHDHKFYPVLPTLEQLAEKHGVKYVKEK